MTTTPEARDLEGCRIGVPESRQLDLFADMLERRGAQTLRCPLVDIRDTPDQAHVRRWLDDVIDNGLDEMIWLTGEGLRRLRDFAERDGQARLTAFVERLGQARAITRGPKPVRELRALKLRSDVAAERVLMFGCVKLTAGWLHSQTVQTSWNATIRRTSGRHCARCAQVSLALPCCKPDPLHAE
mgnify:CR=1 FL=1